MRSSNCCFVTWSGPTTATSSGPSFAVEPPPQPASSAAASKTGKRAFGIRMREGVGRVETSSGGLARGQHSIDQFQRLREFVAPQRHLAVARGVDGGVLLPAQLAQLAAAE